MSDSENQTETHHPDQIFRDPTGLIRLPKSSKRVEDPEEEVFLLYTALSSRQPHDISSVSSFPGLGSVDSKQDILIVQFILPPPPRTIEQKGPGQACESTPRALENPGIIAFSHASKSRRNNKRAAKLGTRCTSPKAAREQLLEINLLQDKTALRSKRGDTGSVLWRVSVALGQALLTDLCSDNPFSLFDPAKLRETDVLELGAGTGLLSLILAPWVRHYTATDVDYLVPLIKKNVATNKPVVQQALAKPKSLSRLPKQSGPATAVRGKEDESLSNEKVTVESLDWLGLQGATPHIRRTAFHFPHAEPPGLIVIADCVYNPALIPALLATVDYYAAPRRSCVMVAVELRSADVVREFLREWVELGRWEIWRIGSKDGVDEGFFLEVEFAVWVGWKVDEQERRDRSCSACRQRRSIA